MMRIHLLILLIPILFSCKPNNFNSFYKQGQNYLEKENYILAIDSFTNSLKYEPNNINALIYRGYCFCSIDNFPDAISDFEKVISLDSHNAFSYLMLGSIYKINNDYELALEYINKSLEIDPNNDAALREKANIKFLSNYKSTGIFQIDNIKDRYGDKTDEKYITNMYTTISGSYSNSATDFTLCNVTIFVYNQDKIAFSFKDAGGTLNSNYKIEYYVRIENENNIRYDDLYASINNSELYIFNKESSNLINNMMLDSEYINISMVEKTRAFAGFKFRINCTDYKNAFDKLFE